MATKKKATAKRASAGKLTPKKKSAKKKSSTKKAAPRKTSAAKKKTTSRRATAPPRAIAQESLESPQQCGLCVREVVEAASGRKPKLDDKLSDLFVPCNPAVMRRLRELLRRCSDRPVEPSCAMTVRRLMIELCR